MNIAGVNIYKAEEAWKTEKLVEFNGFYGKGESLGGAIQDLVNTIKETSLKIDLQKEELDSYLYHLSHIDFNKEIAFFPETNLQND